MKNLIRRLFFLISLARRGLSRRVSTFVYRFLFSFCGNNVIIDAGVKIYNPQKISVGNDVRFNQGVVLQATPEGPIEIGSHCVFSYNAMLLTAGIFVHEGRIGRDHKYSGITVGNNVWICAGVIVLPGTIIDDNVIVAAGAVVRGHLKSGWVYAGVPAQPKKLF